MFIRLRELPVLLLKSHKTPVTYPAFAILKLAVEDDNGVYRQQVSFLI